MSYAFPNPLVTPVFTAPNGITYSWDDVDSKWVIKQYALPNTYITPVAADIDYVRQDGTSTMTGDLEFSGSRTVKSDALMKINGATGTELLEAGTACVIIDGTYTTFRNRDVYFLQDVFVQSPATYTSTATFGGTTTFTNQTAINFNSASTQSIQTKNGLLFYGVKADDTRPSWEAFKIGIDPNNENFSAFSTGKRFYWTGTYAYLNGSLRNYLNTATWDFRDNDTDNNIVLSIDSAKAEYNGAVTTPKSIATKEYVDAIKTAAAAATDFADFQTRIAAL
jgi:hypothetical protein